MNEELACSRTYVQCLTTIIFLSIYAQLNTEFTHLQVVDLVNDSSGLGFGIVGGRSTGVVVKTILHGGAADIVGVLFI